MTDHIEPAHDQESARQLVAQLRYSVPLTVEPLATSLLAERLGQVAQALSFFDFDAAYQAVSRAAADIDDPQALYEAGYELIEIGLDQLAVAPLAQVLAIAPEPGVVFELSAALSNSWCYQESAALLASYPYALDNSNMVRALYAHNAAMAGDFDLVSAILPRLEPDEQSATLVALARHRYARYSALSKIGRPAGEDLRGWELALHGVSVLRTSDDGEEQMKGRFAAFWESPESFTSTLTILESVLASQDKAISQVAFAPDRDSEIVARVLAAHLALATPKPISETPAKPGTLMVAYQWPGDDPETLDDWAGSREVILYAHILDWTENCWLSPDVAGQEAQYTYSPWDQRMTFTPDPTDPETPGRVGTIPPDDRPAQQIAADLAANMGTNKLDEKERNDLADAKQLLDALQATEASCGLLTGQRHRFYAGGPVNSNRFL
jgi:hypothetical protein